MRKTSLLIAYDVLFITILSLGIAIATSSLALKYVSGSYEYSLPSSPLPNIVEAVFFPAVGGKITLIPMSPPKGNNVTVVYLGTELIAYVQWKNMEPVSIRVPGKGVVICISTLPIYIRYVCANDVDVNGLILGIATICIAIAIRIWCSTVRRIPR